MTSHVSEKSFSLLFSSFLVIFMVGDDMKKLNHRGWGLSAMVGFMIGFVVFLLIIVFLTYQAGLW